MATLARAVYPDDRLLAV